MSLFLRTWEIAVSNSMRILAETTARLLLQMYRATHPDWIDDQTPVDQLAAWLGLHVATFHPDDYPTGTYGFMDADEDEQLIWLQREMSESLRRFTLAHELGHAVLHSHDGERLLDLSHNFDALQTLLAAQHQHMTAPSASDPCQENDVQEDLNKLLEQEAQAETLGGSQAYDPRSQRELAANQFAAELLIPLARLRELYLVEKVPPQNLTEIFGVSHAALLNRLASFLHNSADEVPAPIGVGQQPAPARKRYDEFQQAAIEAPTPALVVAGPGSGKTSTLIGRVQYLLETTGIAPQQILALTFSRKAAREMEERLQQVLMSESQPVPQLPTVSTFHAFCANVLRQHGTSVGLRGDFTLLDDAEGYFLLRQLANKLRLRHYQKLQAPAYYFPDMLKAISRAKDELVTPGGYEELAQRMYQQAMDGQDAEALEKAEQALEIAQVYALYQQELLRRGDTDFGGLLMLTLQLFNERPDILREQQQRYQHILVDEFQDVNRASGVLLRTLAGTAQRVWVVGDANQAIYGFRGASPANISQFEQDFPGAVVLPLSRNYRSRPDLVALAEAFRCGQLERDETPGKNQPVRLPETQTTYITLAQANNEQSELQGIAQDIQYKHNHGYDYKDMIVLCRTRAQAQKISRTLAVADIPIVEQGGMLEQEHIKDVLSILLLLTDSSGMGLLRAARQNEHPLSQHDIEALLLAARAPETNVRRMLLEETFPTTISSTGLRSLTRISHSLRALMHIKDVWSLLAQYLLIETDLVRTLLTNTSKRSSALLADYERLLQLARHYDQQQALRAQQFIPGDESDKTPADEKRVRGFLEYLNLLVLLRQDGASRQNDEGLTGEEADVVRVMTVHASKGLEFPVVYMPMLVQRRFPMQARANAVAAPAGMLLPESEGQNAHESGEACLFYVGVTRARDQLVLSHSERYGKLKYKRSSYLDLLEAGLPAERFGTLLWEFSAPSPIQPDALPDDWSGPSTEFINAMRPPALSASAIEAYQRCPRQYAYSAIYHFNSGEDSYQLFWQATHKTVEQLHKQLHEPSSQPAPIPGQQEVKELYNQHWQALGGPEAPFATLYEEHGHEVVEAMRRKLSTQQDVTWQAREPFDIDIAGQKVRVTVDRVEAATNTNAPVTFVRTRFGKRRGKPAAETRELFYTLASRQQYPGQNVELRSHNMSTGEIEPITLTTRKEQGLYESVEQAIRGLERNDYPAQPAEPFRCPTCPFFLICPA